MTEWNDNQPIYLQLRDKIINQILEGKLKEGEAIPSVRQISTEYRINHLTVAKAYQELVTEGLLEKRRGLGMFILPGARQKLLAKEREKFRQAEFPDLLDRIRYLGISKEEMIEMINNAIEDKN